MLMALLSRLGVPFALTLAASYGERKFLKDSFLLETTSTGGLPRGFGVTAAILLLTCFWLLFYGFVVVAASRPKYMKLAEKDGEKDVKERYDLPNLYAQGTSKHVAAFNNIQRSHQAIIESFPSYLLMSLMASLYFPHLSAVNCIVWLYSRVVWCKGYCSGEGRYSHPHSWWFWKNMSALFLLGIFSSTNLAMGHAFFWDAFME